MRTLKKSMLPIVRTRRRAAFTISATIAASIVLAGCTAPAEPTTGHDHATSISHVHAIVPNPSEDGYLLGAHDGIYTATPDGEVGSRIETTDFDAMGLGPAVSLVDT